MRSITIITLFSGRWSAWEPYWHGILSLDYPRENMKFIWYSNANDSFVKFLHYKAQEGKDMGLKIQLFQDKTIQTSDNAFEENGKRPAQHAIIIAALYNSALMIAGRKKNLKRIMFIEDDVNAPSNCIRRLSKDLDMSPKACYVATPLFDRHKPQLFAWDFEKTPKGFNGNMDIRYRSFSPKKTWGVNQIGLSHLGCTIIDFEKVPHQIRMPIFKPQSKVKGAEHFIGCDIVFCFDVWRFGGECLIDYRERGFHYDSQNKPH